jgi:multisubunit Na+/H+ antiporter MnhG subunit
MGDKTDIQALTEQMQVLNANMQAISEKLDKAVGQISLNPINEVIRSSADNAKSNAIVTGIITFIFTAFIIAGVTQAFYIKNAVVISIIVLVGAAISAFFIARWSYRYTLANPRKYLATDARYTVAGANSSTH